MNSLFKPTAVITTMVMMMLVQSLGLSRASDQIPFTRYELYQYLSEKTQIRVGLEIFYSDLGRLQAVRDGKCFNGKWSTTEEGALCWHVTGWGKVACESYINEAGHVLVNREGKFIETPSITAGNTLECKAVAPGATVMTGVEAVQDFGDGLLDREQTLALLTNHTVVWGESRGLYYASDFSLEKTWDGVRSTGSWQVNETGAVCWNIPGWGPTPCESYYFKKGLLFTWFNKKHGVAAKHVAGNHLMQLDHLALPNKIP